MLFYSAAIGSSVLLPPFLCLVFAGRFGPSCPFGVKVWELALHSLARRSLAIRRIEAETFNKKATAVFRAIPNT